MKTTRLIGSRCKHGDVFSQRVLIGRGLDLERIENVQAKSNKFAFVERLFSFEGTLRGIFEIGEGLNPQAGKTVLMAVRIHLFPSRTQKLSSLASTILGWRRPGKIDRRRHFKIFDLYRVEVKYFY